LAKAGSVGTAPTLAAEAPVVALARQGISG